MPQPRPMQHAMITGTNTYEYHFIFEWLCEHRTCPLTDMAIPQLGEALDRIIQCDTGHQARLQSRVMTDVDSHCCQR